MWRKKTIFHNQFYILNIESIVPCYQVHPSSTRFRSIQALLFLQELLVIPFLAIVVIPFQPKIRTMTGGAVTVLYPAKEPGCTRSVITPTWTVSIITDNTHQALMESTGISGKDITTLSKELRWKSDQFHFRTFCLFPAKLCKIVIVKETQIDRMNKDSKQIRFAMIYLTYGLIPLAYPRHLSMKHVCTNSKLIEN